MFKTIPDYPKYQVNQEGVIRRVNKNGYHVLSARRRGHAWAVQLTNENGTKDMYVHRAVMLTHGEPQPEGLALVLHRDDDTTNNHLSNLIWGNTRMNTLMAIENGCFTKTRKLLTIEEAREVRARYAAGESGRTLGQVFDVDRTTIHNIVNNKIARLAEGQ